MRLELRLVTNDSNDPDGALAEWDRILIINTCSRISLALHPATTFKEKPQLYRIPIQ